MVSLHQLLSNFLQLLIQGMDDILVLSLFIHQICIMLPDQSDDSLLRNATVLKGRNTHQGLRKEHIRQSKFIKAK